MIESEYVVNCQNVSKDYKIWKNSSSRLKAPIWALFRRAFDSGKEDNPYYSTFSALKNVSFKLKRGESIGIIGRNGSGKSTLLQILAGTLQPTRGTSYTRGRVAALLELGSGFNPEFSGRENIYLYAAILGFDKKSIHQKVQEIIDFSELEKFIDQPLKTYSSGMTIRLAFSVRIHLDPEVLIIDEALAVGDYYFVQKCTRFIREFIKNKTLVLVTHDLTSVQSICERCIWLKDGEIMYDGSPKEAVEKYLAFYHNAQHGSTNEENISNRLKLTHELSEEQLHDQREEEALKNRPNHWSVLLLEEPSDSFGSGEGHIVDCYLEDTQGRRLSGVVGGEIVRFTIMAKAETQIELPILGFNLKDRHGQYIFGDNTYLSNKDQGLKLEPEQEISATFEFRIPILRPGTYAFIASFSRGTQESHTQIQWIHEALLITSQSRITHQGICGVPMHKIVTEIHQLEPASENEKDHS